MSLRIGIAGPLDIRALSPYFEVGNLEASALPNGLGGSPLVWLVQALLEAGHSLTLFTLDRQVMQEEVLQGARLRICIGHYRPVHRARDLFQVERDYLASAIRREQPDLVHAHWTYEFALGALDSGVPTLVTAHDAPFRILQLDPHPYRLVRVVMAWKVARRTRHLTAVSDHLVRHWQRYFNYRESIEIIPNGLPEWVFGLGGRYMERITTDVRFATVLNGWSRLKNAKVALQAHSRARMIEGSIGMSMLGEGYGEGGAAHRWASRKNLDRGVSFLGSKEHSTLLAWLANQADVLVHPSREEALSMAIAEAMALGIPVIGGASSGGVPSTLEKGRAGLLVDVRSSDAVAAAMLQLARDSALRRSLGEAGRQSALRLFHIKQIRERYEKVYERVVECRSAEFAGAGSSCPE